MKELEKLQSKDSLSDQEKIKLSKLYEKSKVEKWEIYKNDVLLFNSFEIAESEFDRVDFFLKQDLRRNFIWKYKCRSFPYKINELLEKYLSQESKTKIDSLESKAQISPIFTREITNEILSGCLYPSPHAFRHMWAEAVYRRFDGDVGWMIRSNFKHVSSEMWLAYIRNKDSRRIHGPAKRAAIFSLMHNYAAKKGSGYAGATDKYLRRIFLNTHISTVDQLHEYVTDFSSSEIEDIKSNPWGFCILRRRNRHYAKCSELGVPQRHKASPGFCLGCRFNLTNTGNIEEILISIGNNIKVLENDSTPLIFKRESHSVVKNALGQLVKLGASDEVIHKIRVLLKKNGQK